MFLGVKGGDQQYFVDTAIGLAYEFYEHDDPKSILKDMERHINAVLSIPNITYTIVLTHEKFDDRKF